MVKIHIAYEGGLRTTASHGPSGTKIQTDAPIDNHGRGETFSPTDLCATALGACMATVMGIYAERNDIDLTGMTIDVEKEMTAGSPRRIARLGVVLRVPLPAGHPQAAALVAAANACPVHHSLHPEVVRDVRFEWIG